MAKVTIEVSQWMADHLKLWEDSGVPAPMNELQSISAWLATLHECKTVAEVGRRMRSRMVLLMTAAEAINEAGPEVEDEFGIFEYRSREEVQK